MAGTMIDRRPGETEFDYHRRIVRGKLVDKTLADYDFSELSECVYGKEYSADVARRMMYGSKFTLDLMDKERVCEMTDDSVIRELRLETAALERERQRFFDQRREYKKLTSADGRWEHLTDVLSEAAAGLQEMRQPEFRYEQGDVFSDAEAVLVLGDWHYGMVTDNHFNTYNRTVCEERLETVISKAIPRIRAHGCKKLHVVVLGDLIHGAIHVSGRVASDELVCDQLMRVSELLAQAIQALSAHVEEISVHITYGNHARTVQNKGESIHRDNLERIIPWWLSQRFRDRDDITIMPDDGTEIQYICACGHWLCAAHGDLDSVQAATTVFPALAQRRHGIQVEYAILGDKHHRASYESFGVSAVICGSLCGTDNYANGKRLYSEPSQMLLIVTPEEGVDAEYRLRC